MSRFDYVKYNDETQAGQAVFRLAFQGLEDHIVARLPSGRAQSLVLTKLEEAFMWVGKSLRDKQLEREQRR